MFLLSMFTNINNKILQNMFLIKILFFGEKKRWCLCDQVVTICYNLFLVLVLIFLKY
ncbi:hypothetical protein DI53_2062 [Sphingobacterium deserti]|uniref:Uncharacterized protein n=1 Tax=Sphingobacterium deserti TaxID=1229276 RepID=A0A0B8T0P1_9SPHI|nr:hypothetical protein DI53_2062 [Sphingobacterium deserti]